MHPDKPPGKRKQWYIYLGGGEVDECQSQVLMGAVVKAKDWTWAALTLVASWILLGCCPCGDPLLADPNLFRTEDAADGDPVCGPERDSEAEDPLPAIDDRVNKQSRQQRLRFYRLCREVARKFVEQVDQWPWRTSGMGPRDLADQRTRAELGRTSADLFWEWMDQRQGCGRQFSL